MRHRSSLFLTTLLLAGCATPPLPLTGEEEKLFAPALLSTPTDPAPPTPVKPARFTLARLRELVLGCRTPRLRAESRRCREALARRDQAALWPNPVLAARKERLGHRSTGIDLGLTKVELAQKIELGGKRDARTRRTGLEARVVLFGYLDRSRRTLLAAQSAWADLLRYQEGLELARQVRKLTRERADLAREMLKTGRIDEVTLNRYEVEAARSDLVCRDLEGRHRQAGHALEGLLGLDPGTVLGATGAWIRPTGKPGAGAPQLVHHPRYRGVEAAYRVAETALEEARSKAWPDLTLIVMGLHDEFQKEDYFGLGFSLPLPLFDRNQGGRQAATETLARIRSELRAEAAELEGELGAAKADRARAERLLAVYEKDLLPRLQESCELVRLQRDSGRASRLQELQARILLVETRREALDHRLELARAAFTLEYLTAPPSGTPR